MGAIKIQITELTIPNDFKIYYKAGTDVTGLSLGINPYPMGSDDPISDGFTDYGQIFLGGTSTVDLIGDFIYGQVYWIMAQELNHHERWMVKNIKINAAVIYQSFLNVTPTQTPSVSPTPSYSQTPVVSSTPTITPTRSRTPSISNSPILSPSLTPSHTPTLSKTPNRTPTPSITPSRHGQPVTVTNLNGAYGVVMVVVQGSQVLDIAYNVNPGQQKVGSTVQTGLNKTVSVEISAVSLGEHIQVNGICTATSYNNILTFTGIDTTFGVTIYYGAGLC